MTDFDVLGLGTGAPGEHCAAALAAGGLRVARRSDGPHGHARWDWPPSRSSRSPPPS